MVKFLEIKWRYLFWVWIIEYNLIVYKYNILFYFYIVFFFYIMENFILGDIIVNNKKCNIICIVFYMVICILRLLFVFILVLIWIIYGIDFLLKGSLF